MEIEGQIIDNNGYKGIPYASVVISDQNGNAVPGSGGSADANGYFSLDVPNPDTNYLLITSVGYKPVLAIANTFEDNSAVAMNATAQDLSPVVVTASAKPKVNYAGIGLLVLGVILLNQKKGKSVGDIDWTKILVDAGIGAAAYFIVVKPLLQTLGIMQSGAQAGAQQYLKGQDNNATSPSFPFSPQFYQNAPAGSDILTQASADAIAAQIYSAVGYVYDTPADAMGAFEQLSTQAQVSFVADRFNTLYGTDLYTWLRLKFDTATQMEVLQQIVTYVNNLPKYNS